VAAKRYSEFEVTHAPSKSGAEQAEAIAHGDGPCIVVAAPGSGKTHIVTQRFIRLVRDDGIDPHAILTLTYNRRAADEMLSRVERELGPISDEPPLTTYHSWARGVVRRFGWRLGWSETFRVPSGAERSMHLADVLAETRAPSLFNPARPYESVRAVKTLIERAKQELVQPEAYVQFVEATLATNPSGEDQLYWERHRDLALIYTKLQGRYRSLSLIDHDDAIAIAARLLATDEVVRDAYDSIRYVMVDEFQDTNSAQAAMVQELVQRHRNIMVVADDDQAIYRFRGASRLNIERFRQHFHDRRELRLGVNRRSTPQIVALSRSVIERAERREAKSIEAHRETGGNVRVMWAPHYRGEAEAVVQTVRQRQEHGAALRDIAVLSQRRDDMEPVSRALRAAGIPHVLDKGRELFRTHEIKTLVALLEAIRDPEAPQAVLRCLHLPAWRMTEAGRREVFIASRRRDDDLLHVLATGALESLSDEDRARGEQLASDLLQLQAAALNTDVRELFEEAMLRTDFPSLGNSLAPVDRAQFAANASRFYEIIDEYCQYNRGALLGSALDYLVLVRETGEEREAALDYEANAVRISTIHGSKGLEWPHVIVIAAAQGRLPRRDQRNTFELPPEMVEGLSDVPGAHKEEQRRLFYVAMTRARDSLTITWARSYRNDYRDSKRTEFLDGIGQDLYEGIAAPAAELVAPRKHRLPPEERTGRLALSYSDIDDFKDCPRRYEFRSLWRIPPIFSAEGWYGDLLHRLLYRLGQLRLGGQAVLVDTVAAMWATEWEQAGDRGRVRHLREPGLAMLQSYVQSSLWTEADVVAAEFPFKVVADDSGAWVLTGKIDRIDMGTFAVPVVVDYKSGNPGDEDDARRSLQLKIYAKVAMNKYNTDTAVGSLHWLQSAEASSVQLSRDDIDKLDYRLFKMFEEVEQCKVAGYYPARPSSYRCGHCAFRVLCPERAD
jgi:DNA helicase II / ATP-dependent DNA helicase PcrA